MYHLILSDPLCTSDRIVSHTVSTIHFINVAKKDIAAIDALFLKYNLDDRLFMYDVIKLPSIQDGGKGKQYRQGDRN